MKNLKKITVTLMALGTLFSVPSYAGVIGHAVPDSEIVYTGEFSDLGVDDDGTKAARITPGPKAPAYWEEDVAGVRYNKGNGQYDSYANGYMNYDSDGMLWGVYHLQDDGSVTIEYGPQGKPYFETDPAGFRYNLGNGTYAVNQFVTDEETGKVYYFSETGYAVQYTAPDADCQ